MYWGSSVVFSYHAFIAFVGNQLVAGLNTFAILFPAFEFLLAVGCPVYNCDLRALFVVTVLMGMVLNLGV